MKVFSKVKAGGAGGGLTTIITWLVVAWAGGVGYDISPEGAAIVAGLLVTTITFLFGFFKVERVGRY